MTQTDTYTSLQPKIIPAIIANWDKPLTEAQKEHLARQLRDLQFPQKDIEEFEQLAKKSS